MKINKEKEILLPQKLLKGVLRYEYETGLFYWLVANCNRVKVGQVAGCLDNHSGYVRIMINGHIYAAHRLAWLYVYGEFPQGEHDDFIDHINGNRVDNRIENLRTSSTATNAKNKQKNSRNNSGFVGVFLTGMWNGSKTKKNWYWVTHWQDENGKGVSKKFSIHKLGEDAAKAMAIVHRVEQIRLLEQNHGIVYSDRHGK